MALQRLKKGDRVVVLTGRDRGKTGSVVKMLHGKDRAIVQGVNLVKRHQRQSPTEQGGIIEKEASIHVSNLAHVDPKDDKPTRIGIRTLDDGKRVRFAKRSGEVIDA